MALCDLVSVNSIVNKSPSKSGNNPGTHCRGNECCQGDPICPYARSILPLYSNFDDNGKSPSQQRNTPETHCCGNESFQGDRPHLHTHTDQPDASFSKQNEKILGQKKSWANDTCANMCTAGYCRKKPKIQNLSNENEKPYSTYVDEYENDELKKNKG